MLSNVGQESQVSSPLDGHCQTPLVLGAGPCPAAGLDLAPIGKKATQPVGALVIYDFNLICAEGAHSATGNEPSSSAAAGLLPPTT